MISIPMAAAVVNPTVANIERSMAILLPAVYRPTDSSYSDTWLQPLMAGVYRAR